MSCESERASLDDANAAADDAKIDLDAAAEKYFNDSENSLFACGGEFLIGLGGGAIVGALPGAIVGAGAATLACVGGVNAAKIAAIDWEVASQKYDNAVARAGSAFAKYYSCMERNRRPSGENS